MQQPQLKSEQQLKSRAHKTAQFYKSQRLGKKKENVYSEFRSEALRIQLREESLKRKPKAKSAVKSVMPQSIPMKGHMRRALEHRENPERAMQPFKVMRTIDSLAAIVNAAGGTGYARNWQLDELPGFQDFTNLFDQYKFTHVRVHVIPRINTNTLTTASSAATATCSVIAATSDPDDSTTPTSLDEVLEYPTAKVHSGFDKWTYEVLPRAAIAAYGGAFTQFADFDQWLDCASDDVEWYAFKAYSAGDGASQTTHQIWDLFFEVECEFRFVR